MNEDRLQGRHYDRIGEAYDAHYDDPSSQAYRDRFIYDPMLEDLPLGGARVLEAMCGSGQVTRYLLSRGAEVTGLDISERQIRLFQERWPGCGARCASILDSGFEDETFDGIVIVGGLHHVHPGLSPAVVEICRILKPGGFFCFAEPHRGSLPDIVRRFWYRHDRLFADNEESVDVGALMREFHETFDMAKVRYSGNLGYLFVLNSMVFRIPLGWKRYYAPAILVLEGVLSRIQTKATSCMALAQWVKKGR